MCPSRRLATVTYMNFRSRRAKVVWMLTVELVRVEYRVEFPQYDLRPLWSCSEFADKRTLEGTSLRAALPTNYHIWRVRLCSRTRSINLSYATSAANQVH